MTSVYEILFYLLEIICQSNVQTYLLFIWQLSNLRTAIFLPFMYTARGTTHSNFFSIPSTYFDALILRPFLFFHSTLLHQSFGTCCVERLPVCVLDAKGCSRSTNSQGVHVCIKAKSVYEGEFTAAWLLIAFLQVSSDLLIR